MRKFWYRPAPSQPEGSGVSCHIHACSWVWLTGNTPTTFLNVYCESQWIKCPTVPQAGGLFTCSWASQPTKEISSQGSNVHALLKVELWKWTPNGDTNINCILDSMYIHKTCFIQSKILWDICLAPVFSRIFVYLKNVSEYYFVQIVKNNLLLHHSAPKDTTLLSIALPCNLTS